jgi:hypothetical protein
MAVRVPATPVYCQYVSDIEFKVVQRRWFIAESIGGFALALGAVLILTTGVHFVRPDLVGMLGVVGLIAGPFCLDAALGRTVFTKTGFTTRSLFGRRSCEWSRVERVETKTSRGKGGSSTSIIVYPTVGKPIRLKAPFTTKRVPGQDFNDALAMMKSRVRVPRSH